MRTHTAYHRPEVPLVYRNKTKSNKGPDLGRRSFAPPSGTHRFVRRHLYGRRKFWEILKGFTGSLRALTRARGAETSSFLLHTETSEGYAAKGSKVI
ncbi:hypothetical protein EVAR_94393_1 [Eumeta japonica]|uniref:Uncharacterized protein n=1 Tax=Eumeta variegata TaxID=151549 RepID=A0A4C1TPZ6_EUMVA|nr:hypothetical protein EVAR_94393_1 [Eumeta japonica]